MEESEIMENHARRRITWIRNITALPWTLSGYRLRTSSEDGALYHDYANPKASEVTLTLVPYYAWNNRGEGEMQVWTAV